MKQLRYRLCRPLGETPAPWNVYAEATIVTKEMRAKLRECDGFGRDEFGTYEYQLHDTGRVVTQRRWTKFRAAKA